MKTKVLFLPYFLITSLFLITLCSCSNDDEDTLSIGGTNLVGTWAELDGNEGAETTHALYIIKSDGSISLLYNWDFFYEDGYLVDRYEDYTQEEIEQKMEEKAANDTYKCTFSNNTFYWEGSAMAKITVIDKETVIMESVYLGKETLYKTKGVIGKRDFNYSGSNNLSVNLKGKWIGMDIKENPDGSYNVHYIFDLDDRGRLTTREIEGKYSKNDYGYEVIKSPLSQEEIDNILKSNDTVYKYCQKKNNGLVCNDELLATIKATGTNEVQIESKRWGNLKLTPYNENIRIVSTQNQGDWYW